MKVRVHQCATGIKGNQPYIAFALSGKEYDRVNKYHGKDLNGYVIDLYKPKRSDDANRYMWVLIGEIADRAGQHRVDVYKQAVREAGKFDDLMMKSEAIDTFKKSWESNGIAWIVEHDRPTSEYVRVRVFYGSSAYNSKEMSRLIDYVVSEAQNWGIETMPPAELERLKGMIK